MPSWWLSFAATALEIGIEDQRTKTATREDRKWPVSWVGVAGFEPAAFVPKPTPFVVYLANVLLGLQLGVWLRPPMSGIGTARCYSVGYSSAWWARYRITRRYCTRSAATNQRDASRAWRRSANGRRGRNSCTSRLRDRGACGSLRPRAGRSPGPADWAVSGRTGTTWQPPQDHWGPT